MKGRAADDWSDLLSPAGVGAWLKATEVSTGKVTWHSKPPCGHHGVLGDGHTVTEHDDGTITVDPSIFCHSGGDDYRQPCWHGYLKHGVWVPV